MKINTLTTYFLAISILITVSCSSDNKSSSTSTLTDEETTDKAPASPEMSTEEFAARYDEGIPVYYNMYLTVELSSLFENEGALYQENILNPVEKANQYIASSEKALNLGVYAVDLVYARVFEQYQKAGSYFSAMYRLAEELGIPEDFIYGTSDRLEQNITNKDSLNKIADEVYEVSRSYLKENDRESASALIVLGGWIEALYLASEVFDLENENEDFEYMKRLEEQKISLKNLIQLLGQYNEDETIANLLPELKELQPIFEEFEVQPDNINASVEQLKQINGKVTEIRKQIVN